MGRNWKRINDDDEPRRPEQVDSIDSRKSKTSVPRLDEVETFVIEAPRRRLSELIVPDQTMGQIEAILAKIHFAYTLYEEWNLKSIDPYGGRTAINLYGPPGTGKSLCAEAIAFELGLSIIRVNYAEVESKYVGETPKNIKAAFAKAKDAQAILFFDEADSILGKRLTNVTQSSDHSVNVSRSVMLLELDRFEGVTIFATNLASNYDGAFVRRILGHVEMLLPDAECRYRLWEAHLPTEMPGVKRLDISKLTDISQGLSGGDILNCVLLAASHAVQRTGREKQVTMRDFHQSIRSIRKSKEEIGSQPSKGVVRISETDVNIEDTPEDVQKQLREDDEFE